MEAVVLILLGVLVVVSLLANAFKRDGDDVRAALVKADKANLELKATLAELEYELTNRPTWASVDRAYKAGQQDAIKAIAAEEGLRVAEAVKAKAASNMASFAKRSQR